MNIFAENNYKKILAMTVKLRQRDDPKFNFQELAKKTRIAKSYFSKVLRGEADFNADQMFMICETMKFSKLHTRYVMLLLENARCGLESRRKFIEDDLEAIRNEGLDSRQSINTLTKNLDIAAIQKYYLDPINQIVHICLSIPRFQRDLAALATALHMSLPAILNVVDRLESLGIIERTQKGFQTLIKNIHLPRDSDYFKPWMRQVNLASLERLSRETKFDDYSFSVSFSATRDVKNKIKAQFLELLKDAQSSVEKSKLEEAFQLNFQLFSWT